MIDSVVNNLAFLGLTVDFHGQSHSNNKTIYAFFPEMSGKLFEPVIFLHYVFFQTYVLNATTLKCCVRPEYAPDSSDEEGEEEEVEFKLTKQQQVVKVAAAADIDRDTKLEAERDDRRLRRLQDRQQDDVDSDEDREARSVILLCVLVAVVITVIGFSCSLH